MSNVAPHGEQLITLLSTVIYFLPNYATLVAFFVNKSYCILTIEIVVYTIER